MFRTHPEKQLLKTSADDWRPARSSDWIVIECSPPDNGVFRRAYFRGHKVIVLMVVAMTPATYDSTDTERFFGSFRFIAPPRRVRIERLSMEQPKGWSIKNIASGVALISPDVFRVGPIDKPDRFTVTVLRTSAKSAAELATKVQADMRLDSLGDINGKVNLPPGAIAALDAGTMREVDLAGTAAVALDGPSTIEVQGRRFTYAGPKVFIVAGDLGYVVAARYSVEREAAVAPLANAFIQSLRITNG